MKLDLDLLQLYETHYFFEISRKDQLNANITIPAGVLTLLIGACIAILTQAEYQLDVATGLLIACMVFATGCAAGSVFFLVRAYHDYAYRYVSTLAELDDFRRRLDAHDALVGSQEADADFAKTVLQKYADCQHHNAQNNDVKSAHLHRATWLLIGTMIGLALAVGPFVWGRLSRDVEEIQRVEIVNFPRDYPSVRSNRVDDRANDQSAASRSRDDEQPR